jgi:hypothetical protein
LYLSESTIPVHCVYGTFCFLSAGVYLFRIRDFALDNLKFSVHIRIRSLAFPADIPARRGSRFLFRHLIQDALSIFVAPIIADYGPCGRGIYLDRFSFGFREELVPAVESEDFRFLRVHGPIARLRVALRGSRWIGISDGAFRSFCPGLVTAALLRVLCLDARCGGGAKDNGKHQFQQNAGCRVDRGRKEVSRKL